MKSILLLLLLCSSTIVYAQEKCDNGKDDDGDGLIDLQDNDCSCKDSLPNLNYLQNGSFEEYKTCPTDPVDGLGLGNIAFWFKEPASAEVPYMNQDCTQKSYVVFGGDTLAPPFPLPDGKGYILLSDHGDIQKGNKNYAAACLTNTLKAGRKYVFECVIGFSPADIGNKVFKNPYHLSLFGNPDCSQSRYTNFSSFGCPLIIDPTKPNYNWEELGSAEVYGKGNWVKVHIEFMPTKDINVLLVGPGCMNMGTGYDAFYYADNFTLSELENFAFKTITVSNDCAGNVQLTAPASANASIQWYKDSIAITGANGNQYNIPPNTAIANYNARLQLPQTCIVSNTVKLGTVLAAALSIGKDTTLCTGEKIQLSSNISASKYEWQDGTTAPQLLVQQPGIYSLKVTDQFGCSSRASIAIAYEDCTDCSLFVPSAFSPNRDGLNDFFSVQTACRSLTKLVFVIYNRFGQKIFESTDVRQRWDGTFKQKLVEAGTYIYYISFKRTPQQKTEFKSGTVTIVR